MMGEITATATFRKACDHGGTCVAVATVLLDVGGDTTLVLYAVRDSKDANGAVLVFTHAEWTKFVVEVKAGAFDPPGELASH